MPTTAGKAQKTAKKSSKKTAKKTPNQVKKPAKTAQKPARNAQKGRNSSIQNQVEIAQAAFREINPPDHVKLLKAELKFWDSIIAEFSKVEWTDHSLELAAMLARNMYSYEKAQRKLSREGESLPKKVIKKGVGDEPDEVIIVSYYANPIRGFIKMYHENILSARRTMAMHSIGQNGDPREQAKRRAKAKEIEAGVLDDDDDLLAKPTAH